jgi:hypothetical protein
MRRSFSDADIARNEISLLERHVEFRVVGKFEHEQFLLTRCSGSRAGCNSCGRHARLDSFERCWNTGELQKTPDAVLKMHDEIALVQLAEINLCTASANFFCPLQSASSVRGKPAE